MTVSPFLVSQASIANRSFKEASWPHDIVVLGDGIDATHGRALERELKASGLTDPARRLQRDPLGWSAKLCTLTLTGGIHVRHDDKPGAAGSIASLVVAVLVAVAAAVPIWRQERQPAAASEPAR